MRKAYNFAVDISTCIIYFSVSLFTLTCVSAVVYKAVTYAVEDIVNYTDYLRDRRK